MREHDGHGPGAWINLICMVILKGIFVIVFIGVQFGIYYCASLLPMNSLLVRIEIFCIQLVIAIGTFRILIKLIFQKNRNNSPNIPWYR